jgi:hypothetical protein
MATGRARWALGLSLFAVAWGLALIAAAFLAPSYSDGSTLAQENGAWVAIPTAVPAVLATVAVLALHRRCTHVGRSATTTAWTAIALLIAFGVVAILSIGPFALIPAVALAIAANLTYAPATSSLEINSALR